MDQAMRKYNDIEKNNIYMTFHCSVVYKELLNKNLS